MDSILELIKAILPAILVFLTAWLLLEKYLGNLPVAENKSVANPDAERMKVLLPLQLKAYERLILFMERIKPSALVMRVNQGGLSSVQLQLELLKAIREEYEHNQSLQIYVTRDCWSKITEARDEVISLVKIAASKQQNKDASGAELSRLILEIDSRVQVGPVNKALDYLNKEAREKLRL